MARHESTKGLLWVGQGLEITGAALVTYEVIRALWLVKWLVKIGAPLLGEAATSILIPGTLGLIGIIAGATILNAAAKRIAREH